MELSMPPALMSNLGKLKVSDIAAALQAVDANLKPLRTLFHANQKVEQRFGFLMEATVLKDSSLVGKTIEENSLRGLDGLYLIEILRGGRLVAPVAQTELVQAGDHLVFVGERNKLQKLNVFDGLEVFGAEAASDLLGGFKYEVQQRPTGRGG